MAKIENSMNSIDAIMDKMLAKGISSFYIKDADFELKIEAGCAGNIQQTAPVVSYVQTAPQTTAPAAAPAPTGNIVKAPIVGTFYASASPNDKPFASVGQTVKAGDVIFIIESMKVMNEVKSEFSGTVTTINVKNGEAVEFDQPVMIIS